MKFGVIGVGYQGSKHVDEYKLNGLPVVGADISAANRQACSKRFGIEVVSDYHELLRNPEITGVSICTPNETHYSIAKEALASGRHILLEKPVTLEYKRALELVELAKSKKLVFAVGHVFRFNNAVKWAKDSIAKGFFGKIFLVKLSWTNLEPVWGNRDILFDLGPHPFDIINFLFEKHPTEISCIGEAFRKDSGEEAAFVNCKIGKVLLDIEISWVTPEKTRRLVIVGSEKSAFIDCLSQGVTVSDNVTKSLSQVPLAVSNTLGEEIVHFANSIRAGKIEYADGVVGAEIIRIIETTRKALREKRTISLVD